MNEWEQSLRQTTFSTSVIGWSFIAFDHFTCKHSFPNTVLINSSSPLGHKQCSIQCCIIFREVGGRRWKIVEFKGKCPRQTAAVTFYPHTHKIKENVSYAATSCPLWAHNRPHHQSDWNSAKQPPLLRTAWWLAGDVSASATNQQWRLEKEEMGRAPHSTAPSETWAKPHTETPHARRETPSSRTPGLRWAMTERACERAVRREGGGGGHRWILIIPSPNCVCFFSECCATAFHMSSLVDSLLCAYVTCKGRTSPLICLMHE